jgi:anaerobic magnesium-protoporphyrin IX monomethyl ester cyclase
MKRILLVNPHETEQSGFTNPPLGILYIAGTLLKHGFDVKVVDGCLEGKIAILEAIDEFKPELVGITCLTPGRKKALEVAQMVKAFDQEIPVVLGGVHPTIMHSQMIENYSFIDYLVLGEGEQTFLEIAQGKEPSLINGLVYRENGKEVKTPARKYVENLDDLPFPAWHLLNLSRYPGWGEGKHKGIVLRDSPRISVIFSRGCSGKCDFCSTWWIWKGWRHRSAKNMTDELEMLYQDYGVRHFCFADDAMTVDRQATIELCDEIIRRNLIIAFHVTTRTDYVDEEMLLKLKQAGCYMVAFGIETGSPRLLKDMGKENDVENSIRAISLCKKINLPVTALVIVGNVGETEETVRETSYLLKKAKPDVVGCAGALWVFPGTRLYQNCRRMGFIDDDFWLGDEPYMIYTMEHSQETLKDFVQMITNNKSRVRKFIDKVNFLPKILYIIRKMIQ